jgi:hypothetical protein
MSRKRTLRNKSTIETLDWDIRSTIYKHKFRHYPDKINQLGGARVKCRKDYTVVEANGFRYQITCLKYDNTTILIKGGNFKRPCFGILIGSTTQEAELHDFRSTIDCSLDTGAPSHIAARAAFQVARDYGVKHIVLTDNSNKLLPSGKKFNLSLMYFLTTGRTWYETFLPIYPDPSFASANEQWRGIVATNTWDKVYACLRTYYPDIVVPVQIEDIDTSKPGSAMEVFRRIKESKSDFFSDYGNNLAPCSGIDNPQGKVWHANLN